MEKWQIQLGGHLYDLEDIFENQSSESWSVIKDGDHYYLESIIFLDSLEADEVRENSSRILDLINGSAKMRISGFRPIEVGNVSQLDDEGHRHNFILLQGSINVRSRLRAAAAITRTDGTVLEEGMKKPDLIESIFTLAQSDTNVADALRLFGKSELSWIDLYKIYEIIGDDVGGLKKLPRMKYVLKKDLNKFTQTAQHPGAIGDEARHARTASAVPSSPMSPSEANLLISTLLNKWVDSKLRV